MFPFLVQLILLGYLDYIKFNIVYVPVADLKMGHDKLPDHIWRLLTELNEYFRDLCSSILRIDDLLVMEKNIPIILCKFERIFPPEFFDSMEHLPVHLACEAWVCGPVQYKLIYLFEWEIRGFKRMVKNKVKVEGSICQEYISK